MNENFKRLEAELAALQPQTPSPELTRRIAQRLELQDQAGMNTDLNGSAIDESVFIRGRRGRSSSGRAWCVLFVAATVAAGLLLAIFLWPRGGERPPVAEAPDAAAPAESAPLAAAFDESLPSLWQYRRAAMHSPDELDAVLDRHATGAPSDPLQYVQIRGFGRFDTELKNPSGEL